MNSFPSFFLFVNTITFCGGYFQCNAFSTYSRGDVCLKGEGRTALGIERDGIGSFVGELDT